MEKALTAPWPNSDIGKRLFTLLDRAAPIVEQVHAKLDFFARATQSNPMLRKEILAHINDLGAIIEEAEAVKSASDFAKLKSLLRQSARR
jgi:hypothetical protein